MDVQISELLEQTGNLYYCSQMNCFQLGTVVFEVLEDENDGYRSSMDKLRVLKQNADMGQLLGEIKVVDISNNNQTMYALQDTKDGFNWAEFGTENIDDYYPGFIFRNNVRTGSEGEMVKNNSFEDVVKKFKL